MTSQDDAARRSDRPDPSRGSVRQRLSGKPSPPVPWRVEGAPRQTPPGRRPNWSRYWWLTYLRGRIVGALGGRAAEETVCGDVTTGAENDLEQVTNIARQMVGRWGMSDTIGPVARGEVPGTEPAPGLPVSHEDGLPVRMRFEGHESV